MRIRKQPLGDRNIVGAKVEQSRKAIGMKQKDLLTQLQVRGIDLNASGLSKLEGQLRYVTDTELVALSDVLGVSIDWYNGSRRVSGTRLLFVYGRLWLCQLTKSNRKGLNRIQSYIRDSIENIAIF